MTTAKVEVKDASVKVTVTDKDGAEQNWTGTLSGSAVLELEGDVLPPPEPEQIIETVILSNQSFEAGLSGATVGNVSVVMNPADPVFTGELSITGTNSGEFYITGSVLHAKLDSGTPEGVYSDFNIVATQSGISNSPQQISPVVTGIEPAPPPEESGYLVEIRMDSGPVYAFSPDSPDAHTTIVVQDDFTAEDFAGGFVQGSVMCFRDDDPVPGALRVYFKQDKSPDPKRMEIIIELGKFTSDGSAANLGPFTLRIFKDGVTQPIPWATKASPDGNALSAHFPQLGWFSRWRWNPNPRPVVRTGSDLLPENLNLVPNFSNDLAKEFGALDCGVYGGPGIVNKYSSSYAPNQGNDKNPVGVNEPTGITPQLGGVGGRPELGIVTEWQANWICNGNQKALDATMVLGEVAGGIPWIIRDKSTNWAPANFFTNPKLAWFAGFEKLGSKYVDCPPVKVPSTGQGWQLELNHTPSLSYIPYLLTGDPFYLENLQFAASWVVAENSDARWGGLGINRCDLTTPRSAPLDQLFPTWRSQTRGLAWCARVYAECYMATPEKVPSWLQPKQYWKDMLDINAKYADSWGPDYEIDHPTFPQYKTAGLEGLRLSADQEYSLYLSYLMLAFGVVVNQAKVESWRKYWEYSARLPINWSNDKGWGREWPAGYEYFTHPLSTNWNSDPGEFKTFGDIWEYHVNNAILAGQGGYGWSVGGASNGMASMFSAWGPNKGYKCNSWMVQVQTGIPEMPHVGDKVKLNIGGNFTGSPQSVSYSLTAADLVILQAVCIEAYHGGSATGKHPVSLGLISAINANVVLKTAGVVASESNSNYGPGSTSYYSAPGRLYLAFDGSKISLDVSGDFETYTMGLVYCEPNGDGVSKGFGGENLLNRQLSYKCAKTGTSGSIGPAGNTLESLIDDGSCKWTFTPEIMSHPVFVPGGPIDKFPSTGWGGVYGTQTAYAYWAMAGAAGMQTAGLEESQVVYETLLAQARYSLLKDGVLNQFNFSIVP